MGSLNTVRCGGGGLSRVAVFQERRLRRSRAAGGLQMQWNFENGMDMG